MMLTIYSKTTAPTVAVIKEPINPPAVIPSILNKKPPIIAPIIPRTMLPAAPKPCPFIIFPASHPANAPMAKKLRVM